MEADHDSGVWGKWACILFIARDLFIYISNYNGQILRRVLSIRLMLLFRAEALIHIYKLARLYLTSAGVRNFSLRVPVITSSNFLLPRFPVTSQPHGLFMQLVYCSGFHHNAISPI
jgi:hypothetical protein